MDGLFDGLGVTDIHANLHRNIVSLRKSENLYDDLTDNEDGWQAAIDLEKSTKPHTFESSQPIIDRPFEEARYYEAIGYPFDHWTKTRYSDGSFGVWYGADTLETSIYETVYHWHKGFLEDTNWQGREGIISERSVYEVRVDAALLAFIEKTAEFPALIDPHSYHQTQQVGARIHHDGHPGLITHSVRCEGEVYAIFNQAVLSHPRQKCYLTYRTLGNAVIVERQSGVELLKID